MSPQVHRIEVVNGERVAVDWYPVGDADRAALYVHGLGSHRRGEKSVSFAGRFNARGWGYAALDLRGHGDSDGSMTDLTMSGMITDVATAFDWLRERVTAGGIVLIGSSLGGSVIAWHAAAHRTGATPLVMIAPSLRFPASLEAGVAPEDMALWRRTGVRRFVSEWIDVEIGYGLMEDAKGYDPDALPNGHVAPTLILHGMRDATIDWTESSRFALCCAGPVDLFLIRDGDHRLTDHKDLLFDVLWAWLGHQQRGSPPCAAMP
jgi:pimeloyl-ACP methyl ester carboxylesterase